MYSFIPCRQATARGKSCQMINLSPADMFTILFLSGDEMSCRRSAVINVSTLGASITKMPENFHLAQIVPYRSSKVLSTQNLITSYIICGEFLMLLLFWGFFFVLFFQSAYLESNCNLAVWKPSIKMCIYQSGMGIRPGLKCHNRSAEYYTEQV